MDPRERPTAVAVDAALGTHSPRPERRLRRGDHTERPVAAVRSEVRRR